MKNRRQPRLNAIDQYTGLYGQRNDRLPYGYLFSELLETRSRQFNWNIEPHAHPGLLQLFFVGTGTVDLYEANGKRSLQAPSMILVPPTVLHGFHFSEDSTGRILTLADDLLNELCSAADFLIPMLGAMVILTDFHDLYTAEEIKRTLIRTDAELFNNGTGKKLMLRACLQELFIMLFRLWEWDKHTEAEQDPIMLGYFEKFQRATRQVDAGHTVKGLAAELGISPVHLNRICNQMAGKSAGHLLDERLMEEAKKLLSYTSYSVSEIAYLLKFEYPNYFARFFRRKSGFAPSDFRRSLTVGIHRRPFQD